MHAGDHGNQRRLAGAVFTEQHMHLAPAQLQPDIVQGDHAGKVLGDAPGCKKNRSPRIFEGSGNLDDSVDHDRESAFTPLGRLA
jgi:hypothetical protein